jgi:putative CocE/NonD family hydrolase
MPVYLVGGWYDSWAGNTTANYRALSSALKSPIYLIMGPWIHGQQAKSAHGQVDFGKDAAIADEKAWRLEWFDHWLRGKENSVGKSAPFATRVRIFVMGSGDGVKRRMECCGTAAPGAKERMAPRPDSRDAVHRPAQRRAGGDKTRRGSKASTSYDFDPRNPVPTLGGNISSGDDIMQQGGWDQRGGEKFWNWRNPIPLSARPDVVVFQSAPLENDIEVPGEIEVKLWASSSALDTDFTAKLLDVYPPSAAWAGGFDLNLGDGIVRARFRESLKEEN